MALLESKDEESIPLEVGLRDETEVEQNTKKAEKLFEPRPLSGCCQWYWRPTTFDDFSFCCDVDHLAAHLFVLAIIGLSYAFIYAYIQGEDGNPSFEIVYLVAVGASVVMCIWGIWQISIKLFHGRIQAAKILDSNNNLRKERADLDVNIRHAINVNSKLKRTNQIKKRATDELKTLFTKLRQNTRDMELISDTNMQIGALVRDKYQTLLIKLREELIESERMIVETIYNNLHLRDNEVGLDEQEFKEFVNKLPAGYAEKFKFEVGNFNEIAGDDGIFDRNELFNHLDKFIEDEIINN